MKKVNKLSLFFLIELMVLSGCSLIKEFNCLHNYVEIENTATCTQNGKATYKCDKCGKEVTIDVTSNNHNYEIIEDVASTCTTKGHKKEKCVDCGNIKETEYDLLEHNYEVIEDVASTCTTKGHKKEKCTNCGDIKNTEYDLLEHDFKEIERVDSTCSTLGYIKEKCNDCSEEKITTIEKKEHNFSNWTLSKELVDAYHDEETRECLVCHEKETRLVDSVYSMDTSLLEYDFENTTSYEANSFEEASTIFNVAILNLQTNITIDLKYEFGELNTLLSDLCDSNLTEFDFGVSSLLKTTGSKKELELTFTYYNNPTNSTVLEDRYVQYSSLNTKENTKTRADDYDDFAINDASLSYNVTTSEQLVYVLERRAKPIPAENSDAKRIYEKAKDVLREIINDDMSDYQKVKAIHDWLVLNVTYDAKLLELSMSNASNLKSYKGFYLEGVFDDKIAVCEGISKALCILANIEGIPCVRVSGYETSNPGGVGHAWNKIYIDKHWYIIDATSDGTIINSKKEVLSYAYFLISDEKMETKYTGNNYTNYICSTNYDSFATMEYEYLTKEYTMKISSQDELNKLIGYAKNNLKTNETIQIELAFDYGDDFTDEFKNAYLANSMSKGYSYISNGNLVMLINE